MRMPTLITDHVLPCPDGSRYLNWKLMCNAGDFGNLRSLGYEMMNPYACLSKQRGKSREQQRNMRSSCLNFSRTVLVLTFDRFNRCFCCVGVRFSGYRKC
mmetsp:Transcript_105530/g.164514  ORF Transcript_105530/g.164514 Transcript_105530/m.164514 type:complete len:100 (-) Transcript_105530:753-1052(-)